MTEDELIISVQTKDGVVPLMLMNNEATDDTDLSPNESDTIYLINEAANESVSIPLSNEQVVISYNLLYNLLFFN